MAVNPFLRGMTGQQMGVGRKSPADFFTQQASPSMALPVRRPTPPQRLSAPSQQPLDIAGLRRQVLAQAAAPTAPQSRQALMAKYGLAPTAPAQRPSPMQRLSSAMPAAGSPGMAGIGAAGRTMLELSGYQPIAQAPSIGQILARSAQAGIGVMKEQRAEEQAAADKQAAAKRQEMMDAITLGEFNIKRRQDARAAAAAGQPTKPYEIYDVATGRKVFVRDVPDGKGGFTTEQVGGVSADKKTKEGKPSGFVAVYGPNNEFVKSVREGSEEADEFASLPGYRIVESTSITGTKKDVLTTKARGQAETDIFDIEESISDLEDIQRTYRPEFQTFATRTEAAIKAALEKGGKDLSPKDEKLVGDVAVYKQDAWDAVNAYIKYLTGAQMSEAEARRIMKSFPDPRLGLTEGDSPTEYKRKLDGVLRKARLSLARNSYALSKGLTPQFNPDADPEKGQDDLIFVDEKGRRIGVEQMPHLMRREEKRLAKQFGNLEESERDARIEAEMRSIFSI